MNRVARHNPGPLPDAVYRTTAYYELVPVARLTRALRAALSSLAPDDYGVARPLGSGVGGGTGGQCGGIVVSCDVALLLVALRTAGPLPEFVRRQFGWENEVARLVADGLLEVQWNGVFVSGLAAAPLLWPRCAEHRPHAAPCTTLLALSRDALAYGAALKLSDERELAARLYTYNREALTPARARELATADAVAAYLGIDDALRPALRGHWIPVNRPAPDDGSWHVWRARGRSGGAAASYKLYVSPRSRALPEILPWAIAALASTAATSCKLGRNAYGILRPDKFVAYFDTFDDLANGADRVRRAIDGAPPHGVPFTSEMAGDGLLSWGIDPPTGDLRVGRVGVCDESWRDWVTLRLARYLIAARCGPSEEPTAEPTATAAAPDDEMCEFALDRLRLDDVDTDSWIPSLPAWIAQSARAV